jgi:hypothetical protein
LLKKIANYRQDKWPHTAFSVERRDRANPYCHCANEKRFQRRA